MPSPTSRDELQSAQSDSAVLGQHKGANADRLSEGPSAAANNPPGRADQVEGVNHELRRLSSRLMTARDEERRQFARDLHDGIGQELAAAKMMLDGIVGSDPSGLDRQTVAEASEIVGHVIEQVRATSYLLHPPLLDEVGLLSALDSLLEQITERSGIAMTLTVVPVAFPRLAARLERTIFRIVQEALSNVSRHSEAHDASVSLIQQDRGLLLRVEDNGTGVREQASELLPGCFGVGIGTMRERAHEFGGELHILDRNPGTIVEVSIPLPAAA